MSDLREFKAGLNPYLEVDCCARPFVCTGSPLECRSFVVGLNVATRLRNPFSSYWSDDTGFDRKRFEDDHREERSRRGNRPRIEAIAKEIAPELVLVHSNEPVRFFRRENRVPRLHVRGEADVLARAQLQVVWASGRPLHVRHRRGYRLREETCEAAGLVSLGGGWRPKRKGSKGSALGGVSRGAEPPGLS